METKLKRPARFWHQTEENNRSIDQVYKSGSNTESIDQVYRPEKIVSINQVKNQINRPQIKNQVDRPNLITLDKLRGNPLRVIRFLFSSIENFNDKITRKIQLSEIMKSLEITRDSARTGIKFLIKSSLISVVDYYPGLYGWSCYKLQEAIFNEIWSIDQVNKPDFKPGLSNSSNSLNIITTNEDEISKIDIFPMQGIELPISKIHPKGLKIEFDEGHLQQLLIKNSPEEVQNSIYQFAHDLRNTKKVREYESPVRVFMGRVAEKGIPWRADGYISPRQEAINRQIEQEKAEQKAEEELKELKFKAWQSKLSVEEKKQIASDKFPPESIQLKSYFDNKIWPEIKKKLEIINE